MKNHFNFIFYILISFIAIPLFANDAVTVLSPERLLETSIDLEKHIELIPAAQGSDVFTIGEDVQSLTAIRTVEQFYMNAYETTYGLWYYVKEIAQTELGYVFQNPGQEGSNGRREQKPTEHGLFQPVTTISWRDAIIWCNALSEIMGRTPLYTYDGEILRNATDAARVDLATCNFDANGYRLPSEKEWEYAARKIDGKSGPNSFISGSSVSGGFWDFITVAIAHEESTLQALGNENTTVFQLGTANVATAESLLGPLSAPKSGKPNSLGFYDMSGNVIEFCWDWYADYEAIEKSILGTERVMRGGSWSEYASFVYAADRYAYNPGEAYNYMGFRFVTNELQSF